MSCCVEARLVPVKELLWDSPLRMRDVRLKRVSSTRREKDVCRTGLGNEEAEVERRWIEAGRKGFLGRRTDADRQGYWCIRMYRARTLVHQAFRTGLKRGTDEGLSRGLAARLGCLAVTIVPSDQQFA